MLSYDHLYTDINKIIQVYRIRLLSIKQRSRILEKFATKPDSILTDSVSYRNLQQMLIREKRVVSILSRGSSDFGQSLLKKIESIRAQLSDLPGRVTLQLKDGKTKVVDIQMFNRFVYQVVGIMDNAALKFRAIEMRMDLEQQFLNSIFQEKSTDKILMDFRALMDAWKTEMDENLDLLKDFEVFMNRNKIVIAHYKLLNLIIGARNVAKTAALGAIGVLAFGGVYDQTVSIVGASVVVSIALLGAIVESLNSDIISMKRTRELIKQVKKISQSSQLKNKQAAWGRNPSFA